MSLRSYGHKFASPPVHETTLAVQFDELPSFHTTHFGTYHQRIAARFPLVEDMPRISPIRETFPLLPQAMFLQFIPTPRIAVQVAYRDRPEGSIVVAVQPDRFVLSWRRTSDTDRYPSFRQNGQIFLDEFGGFDAFCKEQNLEHVAPNLCEVVYINKVFPNAGESSAECLERVLHIQSLRDDVVPGFPPIESIILNRTYLLGENRGRLYIEAGIAVDPIQGQHVQVKITARVLIKGDDLETCLQNAHDSVIQGFLSATSKEAKLLWGHVE